jgi:gluconate 2-dehydrogenase alpha chain
MATQKKVDVVTVGGGWTAAIFGWKLGEAGLHVVSIERGPLRWANPDFEHDHDALRYDARHAQMQDLGRESWSWRPRAGAPSLPMRKYGTFNPGIGLGGAGVHWSGMLWRYLPSDFRYRSHHVERYGAAKLPAGSRVQDWPLTYEELEPYYDQMEYDIGASGQTGNLNGQKLEGGNPFEAPRRRPFPLPPLAPTTPSALFAQACRDLGYKPFPQPAGITSQAYQDRFGNYRSGCLYCGFCTRYGCEVDAKTSAQTTYLAPALMTGRYTVRPMSTVTKVNVGAHGLATGVTYVDEHGAEHEQPADLVLLTGFTLTNVRMLLLSKGGPHPKGIGNDRGLVGKNFTYQNWHDAAKGIIPGRNLNRYMGNTATNMTIYEFNSDNFDHSNLDFIGGASIFGVTGENHPVGSATDFPIFDKTSGEKKPKSWGQEWKDSLRDTWNSMATITIQGESLPYDDQFLDLDPVYKDGLGAPLLRLTFDWHDNDRNMVRFIFGKCKEIMQRMGANPMDATTELQPFEIHLYKSTHPTGGAIMGSDPGNSVCNKYGQLWDTPNVFVTGACQYPQNPGANPTGTLLPLAYMAGDAIREKYLKHEGKLID